MEERASVPARLVACALLAIALSREVAAAQIASVEVRWTLADQAQWGKYRISLLPIDVALPQGLTRSTAVAQWTRPLSGDRQRWDALPSGTYQIVIRGDASEAAAAVPVEVGEFILAPGDDRMIEITLPSMPERTTNAAQRPIRILLTDPEAGAGKISVSHWRSGERTPLATRWIVSGGMLVTSEAACSMGTTLLVESARFIGTVELDGRCEDTAVVPVAGRATLAARVTAPPGLEVPRSGVVRLTGCEGKRGTIEIPVEISDSRIRTGIPAGCGEASLRIPGFSPVFITGKKFELGEIRDLGALGLKRGAAAAIRVRSGRDAQPLQGIRVTAVRGDDLATMHRELAVDRAALGTAVTDAAGWARLSGLPGEKVVFLLHAAGRAFPQISEPYALPLAEETVIDDVLMQMPATVHVTVSLSETLQDALQLGEVELVTAGHTHWPARVPIRGVLTSTGATIADVPPGAWRVVATGRLKNGFVIRAAESTIDVVSGVDQNVSLAIADALYQGRVTRDGSPVSGALNLKPADRRSGRRNAVATVAGDGTFQVLLEGRGEYSVRVQEQTGGGVTLHQYVLFDDPDHEVTIELPTGRIHGRVVDSTGAAVAGAVVTGTQQTAAPAGVVFARNAVDGSFTLDSVAPGTWELIASTEGGQSGAVTVALDESELEGLSLVVDPIEIVTVRLVDSSGAPLRDAFVTAEFPRPGSVRSNADVRSTGTGGAAKFRVSPAQQAMPVNLVVATSDIRLSCALRRLDEDQTIIIPPHTGELRLVGREWEAARGVQGWLVSSSGCGVPFLGTRVERDRPGETALVFPRIAAGAWSYVETHNPDELAAILTGRAARLPAIKSFNVESGRSTRVVLPAD